MFLIIIVFILFVGGGWLIGQTIGNILFGSDSSELLNSKEPQTIIHNHVTEQHLHISKEELKDIIDTQ